MTKEINAPNYIISILILLGLAACAQTKKYTPNYFTILDQIEGRNVLDQCSRTSPTKVENFFTPTSNEVSVLENNFRKLLKTKSIDCCNPAVQIKKLKRTVFQYTGLIIDHKKYIYINAFQIDSPEDLHNYYPDWQFKPVIICDGGESVWGVLFNLDEKKFLQLTFNGVA